MKILLIDNYDSFTYNLALQVYELTGTRPVVKKNDQIALAEVAAYDKILLSPGPGVPADAGIMPAVVQHYAATKSILGVCLGHQAIGEVLGATLHNLAKVHHGVAANICLLARDVIYDGVGDSIAVGRYHSWVVANHNLPDCLEVTAIDDAGEIMSMRHKTYDVRGLQFHPESVLTPGGKRMMANWINN